LKLHTCADIQKYSVPELQRWFGSRAQELFDFSRGVDHREVITEWTRKSLTVEETYNKDLASLSDCRKQIPGLYEDFHRRLLNGNYQESIRGIVVKLKFFDFKATTKEEIFHNIPTAQDFERLLEEAWQRRSLPVRLVGLGVRLGAQARRPENNDTAQLKFTI